MQGIQGPQGIQGETGPAGENGRDGKDGKDGLNGRDGIDGKDGKNSELSQEQIEKLNSVINKEDKIRLNIDDSNNIVLEHNTEYRKGILSSLTITFPETKEDMFSCIVVFQTDSASFSLHCDTDIKWSGDDVVNCCFYPLVNKVYELTIWWNGYFMNANVRGVLIE